MPQLHLVCLPHYSFGMDRLTLPPLSLACLAAWCREKGIEVAVSDLSTINHFPALLSSHQHHCFGGKAFVGEIPDLPLILHMVDNYQQGHGLLDKLEEVLMHYVQHGSLNFFRVKEGLLRSLAVIDQHVDTVAATGIIGFSTMVSNFFYTVMMTLRLRQKYPTVRIIYGGPQMDLSENCARLVLKLGLADCVILGDGEEALVEVVRQYEQGRQAMVDGTITYSKASGEFIVKPLTRCVDLNALPDPDFSVFSLGSYTQLSLPIYGSRGCMYNCSYCSYGKGQPFRMKDPAAVVQTMIRMHERYQTFRFYFVDSTLNGDTQWLEQFADELIKSGSRFQWWGFFRPWMSRLLLSHLKKAGLFGITMGVESFSDSVLARMGKININREKIFQTIDLLCREGIPVTAGIMAGFPGETRNDFYYTWRQVVRLQEQFPKLFTINPQMFQIRPGSECYENPEAYGIFFEHWYIDAAPPVPEVADLVRKIPMQFWVKKPHTNEAWDRFLLYTNIQKPSDTFLFDHDKELLIRTLDFLEPAAKIEVLLSGYNLHTVLSPAQKRIDILEIGRVKVLLSEKERYIFQFLNGFTTCADIAAKLAQEYHEKPQDAFKAIVHFLYYLLDNDIPFDVRY